MIKTRKYIIEAFALAFVITLSLQIATLTFTKTEISWLETFAVFFSFACTWLCTRQVRFNYALAVISTVLLSITFWQAELYGSMVLNLYLIPTVIYGWFIWGKDTNPKPVEHVKLRVLPIYIIVTAAVWLGAFIAINAVGGNVAPLDGWLLVGSILAQFLMDRKKIENWLIWASVNVVSIYVYWNNGLELLALQFGIFLINAIVAWFAWNRTMVDEVPELVNIGAEYA